MSDKEDYVQKHLEPTYKRFVKAGASEDEAFMFAFLLVFSYASCL